MKHYESIEFVDVQQACDDQNSDAACVDLVPLLEVSQTADMLPLSTQKAQTHPLGVVAVGLLKTENGATKEPLAHVAVTEFRYDESGEKMAVVGGMVTEPKVRGARLGTYTLQVLLHEAQSPAFVQQHGHSTLMARCNQSSAGIFGTLGFTCAGVQDGKAVMLKRVETSE